MNTPAAWQQTNEEYLSAAVRWLRLRLEKQALSNGPNPSTPSGGGLLKRKFPALSGMTAEGELNEAAAAMNAAAQHQPPPAVTILGQRLGLSPFEQQLLLLCAAMELDTRIAPLCARAQDDPSRPYPTFALAFALFDDPAWDALSPERPLRYWRLIEINQPGAQPLTTSALRADERIVNYIKGLNYLDDRLAPLLVPLGETQHRTALPPSQRTTVESILKRVEQANATHVLPAIQLVGPDAGSKCLIASQAAAKLGLRVFRLPIELLPAHTGEFENFLRLWQRESALLPVVLYVDVGLDGATLSNDQASSLHRFLARSNGFFFLNTRDTLPDVGRESIVLDVAKPTAAEQREVWAYRLNGTADAAPSQLASQFNLGLRTIERIADATLAETEDGDPTLSDRLWLSCLNNTRPRLGTLAQRLEPKATWNDIVLPDKDMELLRLIAHQVGSRDRVYDDWGFRRKMSRGLGITALFAGESGTGKTMAAEVIANHLRLNLYRIDLSAIVNKYIGETEKNLRRVFDAAEDGGAILFFDEADALFGKRSEVKDSHDRYANIEINYLLQRMEEYRGLAILATNMKSALDQAFMRRLRFIVNFPFPGSKERRLMWEKVFPAETPKNGLDYDRLARLNLTGGSIHNIALNAAFLAAETKQSVTMPLVLAAARAEFRKLDRPINEADFRWHGPVDPTL